MGVPQNGRFAGFSILFALPLFLCASDAGAAELTTLYGFCAVAACADGSAPDSALVRDAAGNLYGVTHDGGDEGWGAVFELKRKGNGGYDYVRLYTFDHDTEGFWPDGPLIVDTKGNLYGALTEGGNNQCGSIFELVVPRQGGSWTLNKLHAFCSDAGAGAFPNGGLTYAGQSTGAAYDGASVLYGTTSGSRKAGVVFALSRHHQTWKETVLYSFCATGGSPCPDGDTPVAGVTLDEAGNLYGATYSGGIAVPPHFRLGAGVVFELSPAGGGKWTETVLHTFCTVDKCADGSAPRGSLVLDAAGNLFGVTESGGEPCHANKGRGCGTVYKIVPAGADSQQSVVYAFCQKKDCVDGESPQAGLMLDAAGDLYGTTYFGGANLGLDQFGLRAGTVFRISGASYRVVYSFCVLAKCADGANPSAAVITDPSGLFYGTTGSGGPNGGFEVGTAFQLQP